MKIIRHTAAADGDLESIFAWTLESFGETAVTRYSRLIVQALQDLAKDSERPGTQNATGDLWIYHLRHSRTSEVKPRVHRPRHFLLFRTTKTHVEILRYLHDTMDLEQHLPEDS